MSAKQFGFWFYMKRIKMLDSLKYESKWFMQSDIPTSYKIWNHAFCMPPILAGIMTFLLLKLQGKK